MTRHGASLSVTLALTAALAVPVAAGAQPHRARMSRDIADRIAGRVEASTDIIVSAGDAAIDQIALRYGVRVKRRIAGGAVFEATGGQIDAITQDPDVDHVAGDVRVRRMDAITDEATGAEQVWAGVDRVPGFSGRGIGVAVIDSGVGAQDAIAGRVVYAADFTSAPGGEADGYGHGTHVAGIVA
ncbi:MAG TPA: hypothetical protein VG871_03050, partial [Vicinamibacterales bacterium]|nr:hypothetical protein [Vicinamibacterales bacterium]